MGRFAWVKTENTNFCCKFTISYVNVCVYM